MNSVNTKFKLKLLRVEIPDDWEDKIPTDDGWCYLHLYNAKDRQKVACVLGAYPTWGHIKDLGGYKVDVPFNVRRAKDGRVHVSTGGVGTSARYLPLGDEEVIGSTLWDRENVDVKMILLFAAFMIKYLATKTGDMMISLTGAICIGIFTYCLMAGEVLLPIKKPSLNDLIRYKTEFPNKTYVLPAKVRQVRRKPTIERLSYYVVIGLTILKVVEARLLPTAKEALKTVGKEMTRKEIREAIKVLDPILKQYELCLVDSPIANEICCDDEETRAMIFQADVPDEVMIKIVNRVCDAAERDKGKWLRNGKRWLLKRKSKAKDDLKNRQNRKINDLEAELDEDGEPIDRENTDNEIKEEPGPSTKEMVMESEAIRASKVLLGETLKGVYYLMGEAMNVGDDIVESINDIVPEVYGKAKRTGSKAIEVIEEVTDIAEGNLLTAIDRGKTVGKTIDKSTTNLIEEIGEVLPSGEQIAEGFKDGILWTIETTKDTMIGGVQLSKDAINSVKEAGFEENLDRVVDKVPIVAEKLSVAVGKVWYGVAKGAGIDVENTVLNPTPKNIQETMKAIFTGNNLLTKEVSILTIVSDSLTWMVAIVGGATVIYYLNE
jgi:hypothetical protein